MSNNKTPRRPLSRYVRRMIGRPDGTVATYRAGLVGALCLGMLPVLVIVTVATAIMSGAESRSVAVPVIAGVFMTAGLAGAWLLNMAGRSQDAGLLVISAAAAAAAGVALSQGVDAAPTIGYLAPTVVLAGLLLRPRLAAVMVAAVSAEAALIPLLVPEMDYGSGLIPLLTVLVSAALGLVVSWQTEILDAGRLAALEAGEARYRLLFESNPHPMWVYDLETLAFLAVNPAAERHYGYSLDEFARMTIRDIRPPEDVPALLESVAKVTRGRDEAGVWRHLRKDGSRIWVEITSHTLEYEGRPAELVLAVDVTARREAEDERNAQHAILQGIIGHTDSAIFSVDGDYRYTSFNQAHADIMKVIYGADIAVGDRLFDHMTVAGDAQTARANFDRAFAGEVVVSEAPSGDEGRERRHFHVSHSPIKDASGAVIGAAVIASDVTDRRRAEEEARALSARMQHAQKLESLGVLAGGIAHDFNNILMAVLGHAELARGVLGPLSPAQENLHEIERAATRASDLAKQMLAYSGKGRFHVRSLDLNELTRETRHMLDVSISKKVSIRHDLAPHLPPVEADATQLQQVLMNLVINAAEAMGDEGGVVRVTTGSLECDRDYLARAWPGEQLAPGRYVYLEVADTGTGMDPETTARIFDPFFSTKFTGRGLGLAAVLGIVKGHKGAIRVYSEPGKGTSFKVLFPALPGEADKLEERAPTAEWQGAGVVLLVDDEEPLRHLGTRMLERLGFSTLTARDGAEALEVLRERGGDVACVILDLTMPRMDGEETFREIRRLRSGVPVILSSGYNEQDVVQRFAGKGMAGFIQKPYQLAELATTLREALG